jgi:NAD(P)H dehydrogenase (quinone)
MRHLVVYSHPNPKSFCRAIHDRAIETLRALGHEIDVIDLYAERFDPVLAPADFEAIAKGGVRDDVAAMQAKIRAADRLVIVHPIWWTGTPAILKGWVDRVFSHGFAYAYGPDGPKPLLGGKSVVIFNTMGGPEDYYRQTGMIAAIEKTSSEGIFAFCGIEVVARRFFGAVPSVDDATRKKMLDEVEATLRKVSAG